MSTHNGSGPRPGPDWSNPFTSIGPHTLRDLHDEGRKAFGAEWPNVGPGLVLDVTGGRTSASKGLTHDEAWELIRLVRRCGGPEVSNRVGSKQLALWQRA